MTQFSFDTTKVSSCITELESAFGTYKSMREAIAGQVADLGLVWQGDSYNNFKNSYDNYEAELIELDNKLNAFLTDLGENNTKAQQMISEIESAMN